jgi:hypothetical protein
MWVQVGITMLKGVMQLPVSCTAMYDILQL